MHWLYPNYFHVPPYRHAMEPGKQHPWLPTCSCAGWCLAGHLLRNAMWRSRFWTANCGDAGAPQPSSAIGLPGAVWGLVPARAWKRRSGHTALARYRLEGSLDRTDPTKAWQTPRRPGRKSQTFHVAMGYKWLQALQTTTRALGENSTLAPLFSRRRLGQSRSLTGLMHCTVSEMIFGQTACVICCTHEAFL